MSTLRKRGGEPATPAAAQPDEQKVHSIVVPAAPKAWFTWVDVAIAAVLLVAGLASRLWNIDDPRGQIFDETHFTKFATWYVTGHYYVDIHPPLAKLVFAWVLQWRGFIGAEEEFVDWWLPDKFVGTKDWLLLYEESYGSEYITLRKTSAIMGACLIVLGYVSARGMGCLRITSFLAAWMLGMEALILLQSRLILCDVFLYFFDLATIGASFASVRAGLGSRSQLVWCVITGFCLGCCMSVKLTALGVLATVGVHQAACLLVSKRNWEQTVYDGCVRAGLILGVGAIVFFGLWTVHLDILPYSGQGDGFMNDEFKATLIPKTFPNKAKCPNHEYAVRFDCGYKGMKKSQCVAKGCCWDPTSPKAWCYYTYDPNNNATAGDGCPNRRNAWADCGKGGISEADCLAKGCCWDPKSSQAWCYHKGDVQRPRLSWWYKIKETLRATWANNNGGAVMIHPHMSEWLEWPLMTGNTVPFASTRAGGTLKALGNPGVYWQVAGCVFASTVVALLWLYRVGKVLLAPSPLSSTKSNNIKKKLVPATPATPAPASADGVNTITNNNAEVLAAATATNELGGGGWAIPFGTLLFGYYINLVPYELIERSKFVYHYIPALIVGMMLTVFVADVALRWAALPLAPPAWCASAVSGVWPSRLWGVRLAVLCVYVVVAAGFVYWGLPYAYGFPLSRAEHQARMWHPKW